LANCSAAGCWGRDDAAHWWHEQENAAPATYEREAALS
jgi:hypothetical protein